MPSIGSPCPLPSLLFSLPLQIRGLRGVQVRQIAAGGFHSMVLATDGRVFAAGSNTFGQLGIGSRVSVGVPTAVGFFSDRGLVVVEVVCGFAFTIFMTSTGRLYACGFNRNGRIGASVFWVAFSFWLHAICGGGTPCPLANSMMSLGGAGSPIRVDYTYSVLGVCLRWIPFPATPCASDCNHVGACIHARDGSLCRHP